MFSRIWMNKCLAASAVKSLKLVGVSYSFAYVDLFKIKLCITQAKANHIISKANQVFIIYPW